MSNPRKVDPEVARRMYIEQGMSSIEIGKALNCSPFAVKHNLKKLGVLMRGCGGRRTEKAVGFMPTKEFMVAAMTHFNNVASDAAKHYKVKYATWIDWLERFDIARQSPGKVLIGRPSHRRHEIPVKEAVELSASGMTYAELAHKYGVSIGVVARRMVEVSHKAPRRRAKDDRFKNISYHKRNALKILERRHGVTSCEVCGELRALDYAHIKPAKEGGLIAAENVLLLCSTHHRCYDSGTLTKEEFEKVKARVRYAENLYAWTNGFYGGW